MDHDFAADIDAIDRIKAVPTILEVVCRTTGMGFAAVARVTEGRWIACGVRDEIEFGLKPGGELKIETTICHEIRQSREPVVIDHVALDPAYNGHHTPAQYGFQSYISVPILLPNGDFFGTLCAIDPSPRQLKNPATIGMFKLFAELIAHHLNTNLQLVSSQERLEEERRTAELREQFIAVVGHDLRNPLAAIDAGTKLLIRAGPNEHAANILRMMQDSILRMTGLLDNVVDFARGRLGGGLALNRRDEAVRPILDEVVAELRARWPDRDIQTRFDTPAPLSCDRARIAQLFSNLLGNALTHGAADGWVRVTASEADGLFELAVANAGDPIPAAALERLFHPFARGAVQPHKEGLGLGLYIASEIARAHGGVLVAASTSEETRFTFRMPLA